jgi:hypothetical protein
MATSLERIFFKINASLTASSRRFRPRLSLGVNQGILCSQTRLFPACGSCQRKALVMSHNLRFSSARFSKLCQFVVAAALSVAPVAAQKSVFVSFDAPDAGTGNNEGTAPSSINQRGDIAGVYLDANNIEHGFVRIADGTLTEFDAPTCTSTSATGINRSGQIVGWCPAVPGIHGFLRQANGRFVRFDVPGSVSTFPIAITDGGEITGIYYDFDGPSHGFVRDAGGNVTTFDAPNAGTDPGQGTAVSAINANGEIVGYYADANTVYHAFIRDQSGNFTSFDAPGAGTQTYFGTWAGSINLSGEVTGWFEDDDFLVHAFVRDTAGDITVFDGPGATYTAAYGINDSGVIVGAWSSPTHRAWHGFIRDAAGNVRSFSAPFAKGLTYPSSINNNGRIIGTYQLQNRGVDHGFVATF